MNPETMTNRELDAEIAISVMNEKPRIEARALTADETAMALWEDDLTTRKIVREFCEQNPKYHYKECEVYRCYTASRDCAADVLQKCIQRARELNHDDLRYCVRLDLKADDCKIYLLEETMMESKHVTTFNNIHEMPRAICEFALKLWGK